MKCFNCRLLSTDECCDDPDVICLADTQHREFPEYKNGFDWEVNGCRRTNKWILSQDKKELYNKYWKNEAARWEAFTKEQEEADEL